MLMRIARPKEIIVECPTYHKRYALARKDGTFRCPACGEMHDKKHVSVIYEDFKFERAPGDPDREFVS